LSTSRRAVLVEGIPSDDQIEEILDGIGFVAEAVDEEPPAVDEEPEDDDEGEQEPDDDEEDEEPPTTDEVDEDPEAEIGGVIETLTVALANTFAMYLRAHVFHWNIVGPAFVADHEYLGSLSGELYGAVDPMAEHIRAVGGLAPSGIGEFASLSTVADPGTPEAKTPAVWEELLAANEEVVGSLEEAFMATDETGDQGLLDFIAGRLDVHAKHGWFLRSLLGQVS
jgi:starvation-inducible DNA-binding protein